MLLDVLALGEGDEKERSVFSGSFRKQSALKVTFNKQCWNKSVLISAEHSNVFWTAGSIYVCTPGIWGYPLSPAPLSSACEGQLHIPLGAVRGLRPLLSHCTRGHSAPANSQCWWAGTAQRAAWLGVCSHSFCEWRNVSWAPEIPSERCEMMFWNPSSLVDRGLSTRTVLTLTVPIPHPIISIQQCFLKISYTNTSSGGRFTEPHLQSNDCFWKTSVSILDHSEETKLLLCFSSRSS